MRPEERGRGDGEGWVHCRRVSQQGFLLHLRLGLIPSPDILTFSRFGYGPASLWMYPKLEWCNSLPVPSLWFSPQDIWITGYLDYLDISEEYMCQAHLSTICSEEILWKSICTLIFFSTWLSLSITPPSLQALPSLFRERLLNCRFRSLRE